VKTAAFAVALSIVALGVAGILVPSTLAWIAEHSVNPGAFYVIAAVRVAFGFILFSAAPASRAPKTLRALGCIIMLVGVITAVTGLVAIERASRLVEWWLQQGSGVVRLTGAALVALGGILAVACAPYERQ